MNIVWIIYSYLNQNVQTCTFCLHNHTTLIIIQSYLASNSLFSLHVRPKLYINVKIFFCSFIYFAPQLLNLISLSIFKFQEALVEKMDSNYCEVCQSNNFHEDDHVWWWNITVITDENVCHRGLYIADHVGLNLRILYTRVLIWMKEFKVFFTYCFFSL